MTIEYKDSKRIVLNEADRTLNHGYAGGDSGTGDGGGGGGGGAGAVGANLNESTGDGGNGGIGLQSDITGTNTYYAGGGGGSQKYSTDNSGSGGTGGGGGGGSGSTTGSSGGVNLGGGGGSGGDSGTATGGAGGSGIVILRFATSGNGYSQVGGTVDSTTVSGQTIISWTATSGTRTFTPSASFDVRYLVVGGGAGGGGKRGGGGGAGAYRTATGFGVTAQAYTITVGAGGAGGTSGLNAGTSGTNSVFSSITSTGGGGGGAATNGITGGSGGGGGGNDTVGDKVGGSGTSSDATPTNVQDNSILVEKDTARRYWFDNTFSKTGLKAYYNLNESSGNLINQQTTEDGLGSNANGTASGDPTYSVTGKVAEAISFDGVGDKFTLGTTAGQWNFLHDGSDFSISWWQKLNATPNETQGICGTGIGGSSIGFELAVNPSTGVLYSVIENSGASAQITSSSGFVPVNTTTWYHYVLTFTSGTWNIYRDGGNNASASSSITWSSSDHSRNMELANANANTASDRKDLTGELDEVSIWSRVLTSSEITALYNSGTGVAVTDAKNATWTLGGFQPTDISSLAHWFDASDSSTITKDGSNRVSQWNDKKGSDNLVQATSGNQPLWTDADQNSKAVIDFVSSRYMANSASSVAQPNTYFVALTAPASSGSTLRPFTSGNQQVFTSGAANKWQLYAGSQPNFTEDIGTAFQIWEITFNGSSSSWKVNNVSKMSGANTGTGTAGALELGRGNGGNAASNKVGEFIRYDGTLTDAQKTSVYNYLKKKWGL